MTSSEKSKEGYPLPHNVGPGSRIWMLSFECAGIAHAGGLGEAVANLARVMVQDFGLKVTVLMPSHGRQTDLREAYGLRELEGFRVDGYRLGQDGHAYPYSIGMEEGFRAEVRYLLIKGLDDATRRWLDNWTIYNSDLTFEKMALSARGTRGYAEYLLSARKFDEIPQLVHVNDWHMVPSGLTVKQVLEEKRIVIPLIFTVHLLSRVSLPWHYISEAWCGIKDEPHYIWLHGARRLQRSYREVWDDVAQGSFEKFGAYEADYVSSVSESYLNNDVLGFVGEGMKGKSGYIYNGCDWKFDEIWATVERNYGPRIRAHLALDRLRRWHFRKYLLTEALAQTGTPDIHEEELRRIVYELQGIGAPRSEGKIVPFNGDGPMVLMTGRLDRQKGVDILLRAVPHILRSLPEARFTLLLLPTLQQELMRSTASDVARYPENVRLILGRVPEIYLLSYLSADVFVMPSRWEPFGIAALEAMVAGNPVVGTAVGGIRETVLDILEHGEYATGRIVPPEDERELARAIVCMLAIAKTDELFQKGRTKEARNYIAKIPYDKVQELAHRDPKLSSRIRQNCRRRVEERFRWRNAAEMTLRCYQRALKVASYKAGARL